MADIYHSIQEVFTTHVTELCRAIHNEQWIQASKILSRSPEQAHLWSKRDGFFDGTHTAKVLPLHEALVMAGGQQQHEDSDSGNDSSYYNFVRALIRACPWALQKRETSFDRLPLHCACRKNANSRIISHLVSLHKDACLVADSLGRLPVHYALTNGADPAVLKILLKAHPASAKGQDKFGWTPVHIAMSVGAPEEICKLLLQAHPESVLIRTKRGTSIRSCIPDNCPIHDELRELANETKHQVEETVHLPSLRKKSLRVERMILA